MDVCVVLVTYNRCEALAKTLAAYAAQTLPPRRILVVDNHSTDGTAAMLAAWAGEGKEVLTLPENRGGSGGFYAGMRQALLGSSDWVFLSDDDALPAPDALEPLQRFGKTASAHVVALCCAVHGERGIVTGHRARFKAHTLLGIKDAPVPVRAYKKPFFTVDFFSYVGTCVRADALRAAGLCREDFFIYSDDFEHAWRVGREGEMLCIPAAVIYHADNNPYVRRATWRDYYATRNLLLMYRAHFGRLAAARRALLRRLSAARSLDLQKIRVISAAIRDAKAGVTGLHPVYRPGWQPKK